MITDLFSNGKNKKVSKDNYKAFFEYYRLMMNSGDCDPAFPMLNYVADRFELDLEQRYWIAFLYGTNYCGPTVYYIYNEFPDYENVSLDRINRWWKGNKDKTLFQTDRAKVKNFNYFPKIVESYIELCGDSQEDTIKSNKDYDELYEWSSKIYYFGRFSIFNYTQALWELTNTRLEPTFFNLNEAESCRNGLCYVCGKENFVKAKNADIDYKVLDKSLSRLHIGLKKEFNEIPVNLWNIETALCAFKKLFWCTRYLGYYIDRQQDEILFIQDKVSEGVEWKVLWDFRKEFFDNSLLGEFNGWDGIRKSNMYIFKNRRIFGNVKDYSTYKWKVEFPRTGECYEV